MKILKNSIEGKNCIFKKKRFFFESNMLNIPAMVLNYVYKVYFRNIWYISFVALKIIYI